MKNLVLWLAVAVVALLVACTPPPQLRNDAFLKDASLVTGEPCQAPCWRNITPGVTSWNDALTVIEDSLDISGIEQPSIPDSSVRVVDFNAKDGVRCCRVYSEDGRIVSSVLLFFAPEMRFGDVVTRYGEPAYFTVEGITDDQATVYAIYEEPPMILYVFSAGLSEGSISEASEVIGAVYLTARDMKTVIQSSELYAWRGYGKLTAVADGAFDITPEATVTTDNE
jgi:hypothetical protein